MIIDLILDRKDGRKYNALDFYMEVFDYGYVWPDLANPITRAMDGGEESDVRNALCDYVEAGGYPEHIKDYINSVEWL